MPYDRQATVMTLDPDTDAALVARFARTRDPLALERLLERHWGEAHRLAARMAGPEAADDVAQQAFLDLVEHASRLAPGRPFGPWFRTLVLNRARNQARAAGRRRGHETRASRPERVDAPADQLDARALAERVGDLPEEVRVPLVLHYWEGLSHAEVAHTLGCPKGTAASRIRRGLEQLQGALAAAGCAAPLELLEAALGRAAPAPTSPPAPAVRRLLGPAPRAAGATTLVAALLVALALGGVAAQALGERPEPARPAPDAPPRIAVAPVPSSTPAPTVANVAPAEPPVLAFAAPAPTEAPPPAQPAPEAAPVDAEDEPGPSGELTLLLVDDLGQPLPPGLPVQLLPLEPPVEGSGLVVDATVGFPDEAETDAAGVVRVRVGADRAHGILLRPRQETDDAEPWGGRFWGDLLSTAPVDLVQVGEGQALAVTRVVPRRALVTLRLSGLTPGKGVSVAVARGSMVCAPDASSEVLLRLAPGAHTIRIACSGREPVTLELELSPGEERVVERRLEVHRSSLTGTVVDDQGRAVPGAAITASGSATRSRADGSFELAVAPGALRVTVEAPGHCRRTLRTPGGPPAPLRVELERAATLELCLVGPAGAVRLETSLTPALADLAHRRGWQVVTSSTTWLAVWTQEQGQVVRYELPAGDYRLRRVGQEGVPVTLRRGQTTRIDLAPGK